MVKMRVRDCATGSAELLIGQIVDVSLSDYLYYDKNRIPFIIDELEPVEEAAPTKETTESRPTLLALPESKGQVFTSTHDVVSRPDHYHFSEYEPVKVIQAWGLSFCLGNVVKYIARAGRKDSSKLIEDLEKAKRYIELELENLKK